MVSGKQYSRKQGSSKSGAAGKQGKSQQPKNAANNKRKEKSRNISQGSIRRVARRGGVKRIAANVYDEARQVLQRFVSQLMKDTFTLMEFGNTTGLPQNLTCKTVKLMHILNALKARGRTLLVSSTN